MPPSYIRVRAVVWAYGRGHTDRQTDTQTPVTTIHFASSTTHLTQNVTTERLHKYCTKFVAPFCLYPQRLLLIFEHLYSSHSHTTNETQKHMHTVEKKSIRSEVCPIRYYS